MSKPVGQWRIRALEAVLVAIAAALGLAVVMAVDSCRWFR